MHDLMDYYEQELAYLRDEGVWFSSEYPSVAAALDFKGRKSEDPHVERLIESFAFLAGRIRKKLDDDWPEATEALLGYLWPQYLAPVPSLALARFGPRPGKETMLASSRRIERGSELLSRPSGPARTTCRFQTCFDVELRPIEVEEARMESEGAHGACTRLILRLRCTGREGLADLRPERLRFCLHGESGIRHRLYASIMLQRTAVAVRGKSKAGRERVVPLSTDAVREVGFHSEESLLPYPDRVFSGFRLLQEYFAFPDKFLFFDLYGLDAAADAGIDKTVEIEIRTRAESAAWIRKVTREHFLLGCTPVINLFHKYSEPIRLDGRKSEYPVRMDAGSEDYEIHSIERVEGIVGGSGARRLIHPFYAFPHGEPEGKEVYWHAARRMGRDGGSRLFLSFMDLSSEGCEPEDEVVSVKTSCTNGTLPSRLEPSRFSTPGRGIPAGVVFQVLDRPTMVLRAPLGRALHWRLISHLTLNYRSIAEAGALRSMLELYDFSGSSDFRKQISGLKEVRVEPSERLLDGTPVRGLDIRLVLMGRHFPGGSGALLASVLNRFFASYVSINSFTRLTLETVPSGERHRWPEMTGDQCLL